MNSLDSALLARPNRFIFSSWPWRSAVWVIVSALGPFIFIAISMFLWTSWVRSETIVVRNGDYSSQQLGPELGGLVIWIAAAIPLLLATFLLTAWVQRFMFGILGLPVVRNRPYYPIAPGLPSRQQMLRSGWIWLQEFASWSSLRAGFFISLYGVFSILVSVVSGIMAFFFLVENHARIGAATYLFLPLLIVALFYLWGFTGWIGTIVTRLALNQRKAEAQLAEVTSSRARLADSFTSERKRIERDLHDGAQQRIVALQLKLGLAEAKLRELGAESAPAATLIREAQAENQLVLQDLRSLVRGIYPQVLTDRGLGPAIDEIASRASIPTVVSFQINQRFPENIESAVYFLVLEALTNASKHSAATQVDIRGIISAGRLQVEVADNGRGGATVSDDGGLSGLTDRIEAAGGTLSMSSPTGGGTVIRAVL